MLTQTKKITEQRKERNAANGKACDFMDIEGRTDRRGKVTDKEGNQGRAGRSGRTDSRASGNSCIYGKTGKLQRGFDAGFFLYG